MRPIECFVRRCWAFTHFRFYFAAGTSNVFATVDIFNANTGLWTTAALSQARSMLSATSLPDQGVAYFAGGQGAPL
jgi:hypothetical protein